MGACLRRGYRGPVDFDRAVKWLACAEEQREQLVAPGSCETGDAQHAAIRLYERAGFTRCGAFGDYAGMPPRAIERSVFFERAMG